MPKELLIADANVTAQEEFEKILEGMDSQLIFAENGEDALLKIKLYKPDLVIADVTMPNKDGFELCKIVKSNPELKRIPFVLLAGIFEGIDKSEQAKVGADGVITKPLRSEEVLPLLENLLKAEPIPLEAEEMEDIGSLEAGAEEAMLSMEGLPSVEGLEEVELPSPEEVAETQPQDGEGEETIIELTDVVDEEASADTSPGESIADRSLEQVMGEQEEPTLEEETLADISLDEIDLDEAGEELELEGTEAAEGGGSPGGDEETEEAEIDRLGGLESEMTEQGFFAEETEEEPSAEAAEAELEEEIDRRIDLVLEEGGQKEEEDTLLELEDVELVEEVGASEEEGETEEAETDRLEGLESEMTEQGLFAEETEEEPSAEAAEAELEEEIDRQIDLVLEEGGQEEDDTLLELERQEEMASSEATEDLESLAEEIAQDAALEAPTAPEESLPSEEEAIFELEEGEIEELREPPGKPLETLSDGIEELAVEGLEDLGDTLEELEELPVEEELEALLGEGIEEFEGPDREAREESLEDGVGTERPTEVSVEEDLQTQEMFEETFDDGGVDEGADIRELAESETETLEEMLDAEPIEEVVGEPGEEIAEGLLEEELGEGEELLEEPLEEPAQEPVEPVSHPRELIREEHVSDQEINEFQKRLLGDREESESGAGVVSEPSDERIESVVQKAVEQVLKSISENLIPELSKTLVKVASERIEKVVQEVVPDLAEGAIKREIERLQKGN